MSRRAVTALALAAGLVAAAADGSVPALAGAPASKAPAASSAAAPGAAPSATAAAPAAAPSGKPGEPMTSTAQPRFTNRLAKEKSPYLLQHAHNPVDWYPWGPEAFERARRENKPIFLSIGYSTCHWCHVMERESFENEDIASVLNQLFVCIKVDREERPDIDQIYMNAVMRLNGNGGWPMTVFLTPDLKPFYGGTYYPPEDRGGRPGLPRLAHTIADAWANKHEEVLNSARLLSEALGPDIQGDASSRIPSLDVLKTAEAQLARAFDPVHGGFGGAPKFPRSHVLSFLLRAWKRTGDKETLARVEKTLTEMDKGGMHDQIGGGFHRYSVDDRWLVPHFEKMLYDQAILARTYLEAYRATGKPEYAATARDIFEYVLRDLRASEGGFYSAEDADSEGEEGKFYVWTPADLKKALGEEDASLVARTYGVSDAGNFEQGWSILHLDPDAKPLSKELEARLSRARATLLAERSKRKRPHLDDKVLADWNGLMIGALAEGASTLGEPRYAQAAARAADFVLTTMRKDGRLLHTWRQGEAKVPGFLEDHAFLGNGLVDLYEATFDPRWLTEARGLAEALKGFRDETGGGWFLTGGAHEKLLSRPKELYDGAVMSGNSMATLFLLRLGHLTASAPLEEEARKALAAFGTEISARPTAYPQMLIALDFQLGPVQEIVVAGEGSDDGTRALLAEVRKRFLPRSVVALRPSGAAGDAIAALVPYVKEQVPRSGKATAYVCEGYACKLPVTEPVKLAALLSPPPAPLRTEK